MRKAKLMNMQLNLLLVMSACRLEMKLFREFPWVPWVPWESHGNGILGSTTLVPWECEIAWEWLGENGITTFSNVSPRAS